MVMTAAALAVTTPRYQWYALLLVVLVALDGRPEWLAFAAGAYYAAEPGMGRYTPPHRLIDAIAYGVPVLVVSQCPRGVVEMGRYAGGAAAAAAGAISGGDMTVEAALAKMMIGLGRYRSMADLRAWIERDVVGEREEERSARSP